MNKFILVIASLLSVNALAADKVRMEVVANIGVCELNSAGEIVVCKGTNTGGTTIRETLTAELETSSCRPACKHNDRADFSKTYTFTVAETGEQVQIDASFSFLRISLHNDTVPTYMIEAGLTNTGEDDMRTALVSVKDLAALNGLLVSGKEKKIQLQNGNYISVDPYVDVVKVEVVP